MLSHSAQHASADAVTLLVTELSLMKNVEL
eukprot:COSAG01_NODE_69760_length_260_cov_0.962733_1_plen_29_part_01